MARQTAAPSPSITRSHETPKATAALAAQAASSTSVAPSRLRPPASPLPTALPTTPPALGRQRARIPVQRASASSCSSAAARSRASAPQNWRASSASPCRRARARRTAVTPSASGNRKAGRPKRKYSRSASQAPALPTRLWIDIADAGGGKARIARVEAQQRHQHDQRDAPRGRWPPPSRSPRDHRGRETRRRLRRCRGICQYAYPYQFMTWPRASRYLPCPKRPAVYGRCKSSGNCT